jgi:hypothetical protein
MVVLPLVPVIEAPHRRRGVAVEAGRERSQRDAHIRHTRFGRGQPERPLGEQRDRAARHGGGGVVVTVDLRSGDAGEAGTGADTAAVVGDAGDLDRRIPAGSAPARPSTR